MDEIIINIDFVVTAELIELFAQSTGDEFVGEPNGQMTIDQATKELEKISTRGIYGKYARLGIMKIFLGDKLVGFSFPRVIFKDEHEWFKLPIDKDYYRIGTVFIDPDYRGRGIMREVIKQFIKTYVNLVWACNVDNTKSAKSAESAGLKMTHLLYFNKEKQWFFTSNEDCIAASFVYAN